MDGLLSSAIWEVLRGLPGFVFRRFFSLEWLQNHIEIDIRPRHSSVSIIHPQDTSVRVWLVVRNQTHFDIEIDRIVLKFFYGIEMADLVHLRRESFQPREVREIYLTAPIEQSRADKLPFQYQNNSSHCNLQVLAECNSKLHKFRIETKLDGIKPDFLNEKLLMKKADSNQ